MTRPLGSLLDALRNPGIRALEVASAAWAAAEAAYLVGLFVFAFGIDGPYGVAIVGVVRTLPSIVLAPLAVVFGGGRRLDTWLRSMLAVRLMAVTIAGLALATGTAIAVVYLLAALDAVLATLLRPIRGAFLPALARTPDELVAANVATSTGESLANLVGPGVAALLLLTGGPALPFAAGTVLLAISLVAAVTIPVPPPLPSTGRRSRDTGLPGLRTVLATRPIPRTVVLVFTGQRFVRGMLTVLIVATAIDHLRMGDAGVGLLTAAIGLGGLAGGGIAASLVAGASLAPAFVIAVVAWGIALSVTGLFAIPGVAIVVLAFGGAAKVALDVAGFSLLQRTVPNESRATLLAAQEGAVTAALALGAVAASLLVDSAGTASALVIAGLVPAVLAAASWPVIRRADRESVVPERDRRLLQSVPMFRPLPLTAIEELAASLDRRPIAAGEAAVREGDPGDAFYIIDQGRFEAVVDGRATRELGPGDSFGEIALVRSVPRTATVRAIDDGVLVEVGRDDFLAAVTGHGEASRIAEEVVRTRLAGSGDRPAHEV